MRDLDFHGFQRAMVEGRSDWVRQANCLGKQPLEFEKDRTEARYQRHLIKLYARHFDRSENL